MWRYVLACCLRLLLEVDSEAPSRAAFMLWEGWEEKGREKQAVGVQKFTFEYMKEQYFWISALTHQDYSSTLY